MVIKIGDLDIMNELLDLVLVVVMGDEGDLLGGVNFNINFLL